MLPSDKYNRIIRVVRICSSICGADIANPKYKPNKVTLVVIFVIAIYFSLSIYTVQLKFSENWGVLLEAFCMVGTAFQGISKLVSGIMYTHLFSSINIFILCLYEKYQQKGEKYVEVLEKCVWRVTYMLKSVAVIYSIIFASFITIPLMMYVFTARRPLAMQFHIPALHLETDVGYFGTLATQTFVLNFAGFGNFAGDMFTLVYNAHIILFVDILKLKVSELNEMAHLKVGAEQTRRQLVDIVEWHQIFTNFEEECNKTFFWLIFVQVVTSGISLVFTLFILMFGDWPGASGYLILQLVILILYCGMGTLVQISNDKFCEEIYNIHWYLLPVPQQKIVLLILMKSQDPKMFMVGGVVPLSVNTFLQVVKTVYSILMMIMRFAEKKNV